MRTLHSWRPAGLALALLLVQGCGGSTRPNQNHRTFSFEQGMEGWTAAAVDTGVPGQAYAPWSIKPTSELAYDGQYSLRLYMENYTDAAKIWIVRPFPTEPGRPYTVDISYAFATQDFGRANLFALLTGVFRTPPTDGGSLLAGTLREDTGNGSETDVGYVWLRKRFLIPVPGDANGGRLYVVVGIWGTWETPRTYYLDDLTVRLTPDPNP